MVLAACGGDDDVDAEGGAAITTPASTTASETTNPTTTVPATSAPPTTAPATTTAAPTATSGAAGGTWEAVDDLPAWAFPPCCADYWKAPGPSPELPTGTEPLADGVYYLRIADWSPSEPATVAMTIGRFELCAELGEGSCEPGWSPENVAATLDPSIDRSFALDGVFRVGIVGVECVDGFTEGRQFTGDGNALASMWSALEGDYATWVRPALEAGVDSFALAEQLAADPASPFAAACPEQAAMQGLVWTAPDGPALLFQILGTFGPLPEVNVIPRSPAALLLPVALEIEDGTPTLYLYEGFIS